jgi:hypothetical protein
MTWKASRRTQLVNENEYEFMFDFGEQAKPQRQTRRSQT